MIRFLWVCIVTLAFTSQSHANEYATTDSRDLGRLLMRLLEADERDHARLPPPLLARRRPIIPEPALVVVFGEGGCVTAALPIDKLPSKLDSCLRGPNLPTIEDFIAIIRLHRRPIEASPGMIVLSPYLDQERVGLMFPQMADSMEKRRDQLLKIMDTLRQAHPDLLGVAVHL